MVLSLKTTRESTILPREGSLQLTCFRLSLRARVEEKNRTGKIMVASFVIFLGVILIFATYSSFATTEVPGTFSSRAIPQNTSSYLTQLFPLNNDEQFTIHWVASDSISLYVLNSTQYGDLQQKYNTDYLLVNFTGMPPSYVDKFTLKSGSVSLSLPQGQLYTLFAGSTTNVVLDSLSLVEVQQQSLLGSGSRCSWNHYDCPCNFDS